MPEFVCLVQPCVNGKEYKDGKCYYHYRFDAKPSPAELNEAAKAAKQKKKIRKQSEKRAAELAIYEEESKEWLKEHKWCEIKLPGCLKIATQVHHAEGKENGLLLDKTKWKAACSGPCHTTITEHSKAAIEAGHSRYRNRRNK